MVTKYNRKKHMSWIAESIKKIHDLEQRLKQIENQFGEFAYSTKQAIQSQLKKNWTIASQGETYYGLRIGLCVDTKDPFAQGRIRVYLPSLDSSKTSVEQLRWAYPIAALGGFDDSGSFWVPPAGSAVALLFEVGDREAPYYIGTVWKRDRGQQPHSWGYGIPEYDQIHAGHRGGYFVGLNDESQVLPPQNTYNYNIKDFDDLEAFEQNTEALRQITSSHYHTLKTAQKHRITMDDGNYECNYKWKHLEIGSSGGNSFIMWDDHMHPASQYANPKGAQCGSFAEGGAASGGSCSFPEDCVTQSDDFQNELFKHESEIRAFRGPCTPQNNRCRLQQTGIFMSSVSGQVFVADDEVEQPQGSPEWERGTRPFDFGCTDKFLGKVFIKSATGHVIKLGDAEDFPGVRSGEFEHPTTGEYEPNGILFKTACGSSIELNDHTRESGVAGERRGIKIQSTSTHLFEMIDESNEQTSPTRSEGGIPIPKASNAYVRLKSGYGLQLLFRDDNNQEETQNQFIELLAPHKDNCHGPHILRFQEAPPETPGVVFLRCGGYFYGRSIKDWIEIVGNTSDDANDSNCPGGVPNRVVFVEGSDVHVTKDTYVYISDLEYHFSKQLIVLAAGLDCQNENGEEGPCVLPIIHDRPRLDIHSSGYFVCPLTRYTHIGREQASDRVFGSASITQ